MKLRLLILLFLPGAFLSCRSKGQADLVVHHARIYTADSNFNVCEAIAIKDGKIIDTGRNEFILEKYEAKETVDAGGKFIYPGFIDAHAHFVAYGNSLQEVQLVGTESWEEILKRLSDAGKNTDNSRWLRGHGWDQNDWAVKEFPTKEKLDLLFPARPVFLVRIDGHAAIANQRALDLAGLKAGMKIEGGTIETKNGVLTGILVDNAVGLVRSRMPRASVSEMKDALLQAQKNCFAVGLTTVDDCGLGAEVIELIDSLQKTGDLSMRIYAMLSDDPKNFQYAQLKGKIKTTRLDVRSFKVYADGALGSRGACLLQPYNDKPGWQGFLLSSLSHFDSVATVIHKMGFQMCTHAIGDSGNRMILGIYAKHLAGKNDLRWRIEHAQVVDPHDFGIFAANSIIPSVQPTHATSDMYWAGDRLGPERVKSAYANKKLLEQNGWIPLGTDFPVEDISPIKTFFAAVVRKDAKGFPAGGYQVENALTRQEALRGMTIWAAKANFEEQEKGSIEAGKLADFIIADTDLLNCPADSILKTKVLSTYINGQSVYSKK